MLMITFPSHASLAVVWLFSFAVANKANTKSVLCDSFFLHIVTVICVFFLFCFDSYKE